MKGVEILGEAPGEIRVASETGVATAARANLRGVREKIVSPVGIASEHRDPKPSRPIKLHRLLDRPSGR